MGNAKEFLLAPRFSALDSIVVFLLAEGRDQLRFKSCGADGKLTIERFQKRESILMTGALQPSKFVGPPSHG